MKSKFEKQQLMIHGYPISPSITREQASLILGVSVRKIDRLRKDKRLPFFKIGNTVNLILQDVIDYREQLKASAS